MITKINFHALGVRISHNNEKIQIGSLGRYEITEQMKRGFMSNMKTFTAPRDGTRPPEMLSTGALLFAY